MRVTVRVTTTKAFILQKGFYESTPGFPPYKVSIPSVELGAPLRSLQIEHPAIESTRSSSQRKGIFHEHETLRCLTFHGNSLSMRFLGKRDCGNCSGESVNVAGSRAKARCKSFFTRRVSSDAARSKDPRGESTFRRAENIFPNYCQGYRGSKGLTKWKRNLQ